MELAGIEVLRNKPARSRAFKHACVASLVGPATQVCLDVLSLQIINASNAPPEGLCNKAF